MIRHFHLAVAVFSIGLAGSVCFGLTPNDPYVAPHAWYVPKLGLNDAWDYSTGSSAVKLAILDTGVISTVPDLQGRLLPPVSATGDPPFSDDYMLPRSTLRHGTYVASVAGMTVNNGIGGAGVGNFSILPATIANFDGLTSPSWIASGIIQSAQAGAKVINISWRVGGDNPAADYRTIEQAAAYARTLGALTFMAAGNSDGRIDLPAYDNLIFVAGTGRLDERWTTGQGHGSSWGQHVKLSAPADDILIAEPAFASGYGLVDGTSVACPLAAGAAALAWSINPQLTADEMEQLLYSTAVDLGETGWDEVYGYGRIDIGALAAAAYATVPEPGSVLIVVALGALVLRRRAM